jgi:hypothetical protein
MNKIVEQFKKHGLDASFHYADDTTKEWYLGDRDKEKALKLYYDNPELRAEMMEVSKGFLWSLESELRYGR